jgi:hypothetical protein
VSHFNYSPEGRGFTAPAPLEDRTVQLPRLPKAAKPLAAEADEAAGIMADLEIHMNMIGLLMPGRSQELTRVQLDAELGGLITAAQRLQGHLAEMTTPAEDPQREAAFEDWRTAPGGERG